MNELFSNIAKGYMDAGLKVLKSIEVGAEANISLGSGESETSATVSTTVQVSSSKVELESSEDADKVDEEGGGSESDENDDSENGISLSAKIDFTPLIQEAVEGIENAIQHRMNQVDEHLHDVNLPELNDGSFDALDVQTNNAPSKSLKSCIIQLFNKGGVINVADIRPALNGILRGNAEEQRQTVANLAPLQEINLENFKALLSQEQRLALEDPHANPGHNKGFVRFAKDRDGHLKLETYGKHKLSCWLNNRINVTQGHNREMRVLFANSLMKDWGNLTEQREGNDAIKNSTLGRILRETREKILGKGTINGPDQIQLRDEKYGEALSLDEVTRTIQSFESAFKDETNKENIAKELLAHCATQLGVAIGSEQDLDKFLKTYGKDLLALEGPNHRPLAHPQLRAAFAGGYESIVACFKGANGGAAVKSLMEDTLQLFAQLKLRHVYDQNVARMIEGYSRNPSVDLRLTTKPGQAESPLLTQIRTSLNNQLTTLPVGQRPDAAQLNLFMNKVLPALVKARLEPLQTLNTVGSRVPRDRVPATGTRDASPYRVDAPIEEPKVEGDAQPIDLEALSRETLRAQVKDSLSLASLWKDFQTFAAESADWGTGNFNPDGLDVLIELKTEEANLLKRQIEDLGRQLPALIGTDQYGAVSERLLKELTPQLTKLQNEINCLKNEQSILQGEHALDEKSPELQQRLDAVRDVPLPGKQSLGQIVREGFSVNVQAQTVEDYRVHNYLLGKYGIRTALPESLKKAVSHSAQKASEEIGLALQRSAPDKKTGKALGSYLAEVADFLFGDTAQELISTNLEIVKVKPGEGGSGKTVAQITQEMMTEIGNELCRDVQDPSVDKAQLSKTVQDSVLVLSWRMSNSLVKFKESDLATFGRTFESYLSIYENHHKIGSDNGPTAAQLMTEFRQMVKGCLSEAVQNFYSEDLRGLLFIKDLTKLREAFDARFGQRMRMAVEQAEQKAINSFYAKILGFDYGGGIVDEQRGGGGAHPVKTEYAQLASMVGVHFKHCLQGTIPVEPVQKGHEIAPGLKVSAELVEARRGQGPLLGLSTQEIVEKLNKKIADAWCVEVFENQQDRYNIVVEKLFGHKIKQLDKKDIYVDEEWAVQRAEGCQERMRKLLDAYVAFEQQFLGVARTAVAQLLEQHDANFRNDGANREKVVDTLLSSLQEPIQKVLRGFFEAPDQHRALCRNALTQILNHVSVREWQTKDMTTFVDDALGFRADGLLPDKGTSLVNAKLDEVRHEVLTRLDGRLADATFRADVLEQTLADVKPDLPKDAPLKEQILNWVWNAASAQMKKTSYTQFVGLSDEGLKALMAQRVKESLGVLASSLKGLNRGVSELDANAVQFLKDYPNLEKDLKTVLAEAKGAYVTAYLETCAGNPEADPARVMTEFGAKLQSVRTQERERLETLAKNLKNEFDARVGDWKKLLADTGASLQKVRVEPSDDQPLAVKVALPEATVVSLFERKAEKMLEEINSDIARTVHGSVSFNGFTQDLVSNSANARIIKNFLAKCEIFWDKGLAPIVAKFDPVKERGNLAALLGVDKDSAVLAAVLAGNGSVADAPELKTEIEEARNAYLAELAAVLQKALAGDEPPKAETLAVAENFTDTRARLAKITAYLSARQQVANATKALEADESFGKLDSGMVKDGVLEEFRNAAQRMLAGARASGELDADAFAKNLDACLKTAVSNAKACLEVQNLNVWLAEEGTRQIVARFENADAYKALCAVKIRDADRMDRSVSLVLTDSVGDVVREMVQSGRCTLADVRELVADQKDSTLLERIANHPNISGAFNQAREVIARNDLKQKFENDKTAWVQGQVNEVFFQLVERVFKTDADRARFTRDTGKEMSQATMLDVFSWIKGYLPTQLANSLTPNYLEAAREVEDEIRSFTQVKALAFNEANQKFKPYLPGREVKPVKEIYGAYTLGKGDLDGEKHPKLAIFDAFIKTAYATMNGSIEQKKQGVSDRIEREMGDALDAWFTKGGEVWKVLQSLNRIETGLSGESIDKTSTLYAAARGVVEQVVAEEKAKWLAEADSLKGVTVTDDLRAQWKAKVLERLNAFLAKGRARIEKYNLGFNSLDKELANFKDCLIAAYKKAGTLNIEDIAKSGYFEAAIRHMRDEMALDERNFSVYRDWLQQVAIMREACFVLDAREENVLGNVQKIRADAATTFDLVAKFTQAMIAEKFNAEAAGFKKALADRLDSSKGDARLLPDAVRQAFRDRYERILTFYRPKLKAHLNEKTDRANDIAQGYVSMSDHMKRDVLEKLDAYLRDVENVRLWAKRAAYQQFYNAMWGSWHSTMTGADVVRKLDEVLKANKVPFSPDKPVADLSPEQLYNYTVGLRPTPAQQLIAADEVQTQLQALQGQIDSVIDAYVLRYACRVQMDESEGRMVPVPVVDRTRLPGTDAKLEPGILENEDKANSMKVGSLFDVFKLMEQFFRDTDAAKDMKAFKERWSKVASAVAARINGK